MQSKYSDILFNITITSATDERDQCVKQLHKIFLMFNPHIQVLLLNQ